MSLHIFLSKYNANARYFSAPRCSDSVELCLATEVNELNAAGVQYFVPHFSGAAKTDIHVL